jgi:hypothetical protein
LKTLKIGLTRGGRQQPCSHSRMSPARRLLRTVLWLSRPHLSARGFLCHDHRGFRDPAGVQSPFTARYSVIGIVHHEPPDTLHGIREGLEDRGSSGGEDVGRQGRFQIGTNWPIRVDHTNFACHNGLILSRARTAWMHHITHLSVAFGGL